MEFYVTMASSRPRRVIIHSKIVSAVYAAGKSFVWAVVK